jgi:hypothetical protein
MNVAELARRSTDIVVGTVKDVTPGVTRGFATIEVELAVSQTLRGGAKETLRFRQLASRAPEAAPRSAEGRVYLGLVPGLPSYAKGDRVLLFLGAEGRLGLRTTVGLEQGRFRLRAGSAENGFSNMGLFHGVTARPGSDASTRSLLETTRGGVREDALVGLVKRALAEGWWEGGAR